MSNLEKRAEEWLYKKSLKEQCGNMASFCDVINWNGDEPDYRFYKETHLISFMAEFAQQETELLSKHLLEMQKTNGALTALFEQVEEEVKQEQRIKELEAYNKKLLQSDIDKQNKIVLLSHKVNDLQKENAELKAIVRNTKAVDESFALQTIQLTKAKELLKDTLRYLDLTDCVNNDPRLILYKNIEQFLNSEV